MHACNNVSTGAFLAGAASPALGDPSLMQRCIAEADAQCFDQEGAKARAYVEARRAEVQKIADAQRGGYIGVGRVLGEKDPLAPEVVTLPHRVPPSVGSAVACSPPPRRSWVLTREWGGGQREVVAVFLNHDAANNALALMKLADGFWLLTECPVHG